MGNYAKVIVGIKIQIMIDNEQNAILNDVVIFQSMGYQLSCSVMDKSDIMPVLVGLQR